MIYTMRRVADILSGDPHCPQTGLGTLCWGPRLTCTADALIN